VADAALHAVARINVYAQRAELTARELISGSEEVELMALRIQNLAGAEAERSNARFNLQQAENAYDEACRVAEVSGCAIKSVS